jgi:hypothetical protein
MEGCVRKDELALEKTTCEGRVSLEEMRRRKRRSPLSVGTALDRLDESVLYQSSTSRYCA